MALKGVASTAASKCDTVKLPGSPVDAIDTVWSRKLDCRHRRETCGHGNNSVDRDDRQPSPSCCSPQHMDAVHRLDGSGPNSFWLEI